MSTAFPVVERTVKATREVTLTTDRSERLQRMAQARLSSEDEVIERALDLYFRLADFFDDASTRQDWHRLSEASLRRVWDNEQDAAYDDWRNLYGVPKR